MRGGFVSKQRFMAVVLLAMSIFLQGCAALGTALSLGAAYGMSRLFK